jgi:hypothetical protein
MARSETDDQYERLLAMIPSNPTELRRHEIAIGIWELGRRNARGRIKRSGLPSTSLWFTEVAGHP